METTEKNAKGTATQTKTTQAATAKMPLSLENVTNWVNNKKSMKFMEDASGEGRYAVVKALKKYGLKTDRMRGVGTVGSMDIVNVHNAIEMGAKTDADIVAATGMTEDKVKATVKKLKNEGGIINAYAIANPKQQTVIAYPINQ